MHSMRTDMSWVALVVLVVVLVLPCSRGEENFVMIDQEEGEGGNIQHRWEALLN